MKKLVSGILIVSVLLVLGLQAAQTAFAQTRPIQDNAAETADPPSIDAQPESAADPISELSKSIKTRSDLLTSDTERTPESLEALRKLYDQASLDLEAATDWQRKTSGFANRAASAANLLADIKERQSQTDKGDGDLETDDLTFEEATSKLQALKAELAAATQERARLENEVTARATRRKELPELLSQAKTKLAALGEPATGTDATNDPMMSEALKWSAQAKQILLNAQIQSLESEQFAYESETQLLPAQVEAARKKEAQLQERSRRLNEILAAQNRTRIQGFRAAFLNSAPPTGAPFDKIRVWLQIGKSEVEESEQITWQALSKKQAELKKEIDVAQAELDRWQSLSSKMTNRIQPNSVQENGKQDPSPITKSLPTFNRWVVEKLRRQKQELPDRNAIAVRLSELQSEMQKAESLSYDLDEALHQLRLSSAGSSATGSDETDPVTQTSKELLAAMKLDSESYLLDLYTAADLKDQTQTVANEYEQFIDKQLLWTPNAGLLQTRDLGSAATGIGWFLNRDNWRATFKQIGADVLRYPLLYVATLIPFALLLFNQPRLRRRLGEVSGKAKKKNCANFAYTSEGLLLTLLVSIPIPILLLFFSWRIKSGYSPTADRNEFPFALAQGLLWTVATLFPMELLRQICRPGGLGINHFGWSEKSARTLQSNLRWLINFVVPLVAILGIFANQKEAAWEESIGRITFIVLMLLVSIFVARVFAPRSGVFGGYIAENAGGWADRLRFIWYPALAFSPIALAILSLAGFHYTAQQIAIRTNTTIWMGIILSIAYCTLKRWLVLNRSKIMLAQARIRLEEAARGESSSPVAAGSDVNLYTIGEQTKRLVFSLFFALGLLLAFVIWADMLPAVSFLENVQLWSVAGDLPGETVPITLANLIIVIPVIVLGTIATRNVPGLLEIAFLQHLPLTNAARYAITTLARYLIAGISIAIACATIGLRWSSIQWLVAALGVGLGFGLQEIFANFVSGIILLFEQPIRVGDVVTIDGTTGTVGRIRMRATTIINWDRQELIVPNKELITAKLINWTLTDTTNRIIVHVGIAYGSDSVEACRIVREVCSEHENLLEDPAPIVTFEGFGDNTLNLVVRAFLSALDHRLRTIHELHERIYQAFNEAGIEIAFPQRDLHIRSVPDSIAELFSNNGGNEAKTRTTDNPSST